MHRLKPARRSSIARAFPVLAAGAVLVGVVLVV
jgi:hypothetical protein